VKNMRRLVTDVMGLRAYQSGDTKK
jgi:hypothetical protein